MIIAIGADHAGFTAKEAVVRQVEAAGHTVLDLGAHSLDPDDDYPDFALAVGRAVQTAQADRGILLCGSGVGVSVAANKLRGIRAGLCHDTYSAHQSVEHDDVNVLCIGPRIVGPSLIAELVAAFLSAEYHGGGRFARRLAKVKAFEANG